MSRVLRYLLAMPTAFLISSGGASAAPIYTQPGSNLACSPSCWISQYDTGSQLGIRTFDDFTLTASAGITVAQWRGFAQAGDPKLNPTNPITTTWNLSFWSDTGTGVFSFPLNVLHSVDIAAANVQMTLVGLSPFAGSTVSLYDFTATLPVAFSALGGVKYWFSPLSIQDGMDPGFQWSAAAVNVNGWSTQQSIVGTTSSPFYLTSNDRAFTLDARSATPAVPEPSTWAMMIGGFTMAGLTIRRRKVALPASYER